MGANGPTVADPTFEEMPRKLIWRDPRLPNVPTDEKPSPGTEAA